MQQFSPTPMTRYSGWSTCTVLAVVSMVAMTTAWGDKIGSFKEKRTVDKLWNETVKSHGREKAIRKLLDIVRSSQNIRLKEFAVDKLRLVRAIEATDSMKALAENLSSTNDDEQLLKYKATAAYHMLRYFREPDSNKKYQLLLDTVRRAHGRARTHAVDELIRTNRSEALPIIEARLRKSSGHSAESYIRVVRLKFKIMALPTGTADNWSRLAAGGFSDMNSLSTTEKDAMERWAMTELALMVGSSVKPPRPGRKLPPQSGPQPEKVVPQIVDKPSGQAGFPLPSQAGSQSNGRMETMSSMKRVFITGFGVATLFVVGWLAVRYLRSHAQ